MPGLALRAAVTIAAIVITGAAVPVAASATTADVSPGSQPTVVAAATTGDAVRVTGGVVVAPARGATVALSVERVDGPGSVQVVSTDAQGVVTISDGIAAQPAEPITGASDRADAAAEKCADSAYSFINGASWNSSYNWRFRVSTTPAGVTAAQATHALQAAVNNITQSRNKCGMADEVGATAHFMGTTKLPSDVTSSGGCGAPTGQNVTEFGQLADSGVLAITCVYSAGPNIVAASTRINTQFGWRVNGACTSAYGIVATMTHEFGHAFGLGHVDETEHRNLTMSSGINASCSNFEANLGRGDVLALRALY